MQGLSTTGVTGRARAASTNASKWGNIRAEIERLGLGYRLEPQYDLRLLDIENRRIQVRENEHVAPKDSVTRFAIQMAHSEFPPIVVTTDAFSVDGNSRAQAKKKRGEMFHPAYVLDIAYATATPHERNMLWILGATLNATNGMPLTLAERRKSVEAAIAEGWRSEQIERAFGVMRGQVGQIRRELEARSRLDRVQAAINGALSLSRLRALGTGEVLALNDEPFLELAQLAHEAGLLQQEIRELARDAKATGSDEAALEYLATKRADMHERIIQQSLTGSSRPPASAKLRVQLTQITAFLDRESELVERSPDSVEAHLAIIDAAIGVLTRVKQLQLL